MFGILILAVAVTGIVRMARTRGAFLPMRFGLLAAAGWLVLGMLTGMVLGLLGYKTETGALTYEALLVTTAVPWAFVAFVALYVKFRVVGEMAPPAEMRTCANCQRLNPSDARECGNCGEAFAEPRAV